MNEKIQHMQNKHLIEDLKILIASSKQELAISVNSSMSLLYWSIGKRINEEILDEKRATYGKQIILEVSRQLIVDYGSSFSEKNLRRMLQFASVFPEKEIVVSLIRQLSWTHLIALIPIEDSIKRAFYIEMCILEK